MQKAGALALALALLMGGVLTAGDEVILQSRRFVPSRSLSESIRTSSRMTSERMHVLIQLEGIPTAEWRAAHLSAGIRLLSYIPEHAWLASIPADKAPAVLQLDGVQAVCEILPKDKLAPSIRQAEINACSLTASGQARLTAILFEDVSLTGGQAIIESLGGAVLARDSVSHCLEFRLPIAAIQTLAACDDIKWIDQHEASIDLNDGVRAAIHAGAVQAFPYEVTGSGVVIGQWESRHPDGTHVDLAGRVTNVGDELSIGDHATQVAGTIIGDGSLLADRRYRGMAPAATLVSFPTWDTVAELRQQYQEAIDIYGVDIANNSWGKVEWHVYKDYAAAMDDIVRGSLGKRLPMVWAVGNEGSWSTILCTAAAKNIVTVGATNSDDNSLWTWSNKGPTKDGRIKPEVVSPGCQDPRREHLVHAPRQSLRRRVRHIPGGALGHRRDGPDPGGLASHSWRGPAALDDQGTPDPHSRRPGRIGPGLRVRLRLDRRQEGHRSRPRRHDRRRHPRRHDLRAR